jgi:O-antigen/teichoic acid export membrane protein
LTVHPPTVRTTATAVPADPARAVAVSTASQLAARLLHLALNVASSVILIRYMGPDSYGDYVRVIIVTGWVGLLSEFGLNKLGVRHAARDDATAGTVVGTVMGTRAVLSVVAAGVAQLTLLPLHASATVHVAALVASLLFVFDGLFATVVVFQVTLKQHYEAGVRVLMEVVELAILVLLVASGAGLVALISAPVVGAGVGTVLAYALARRRFALRLSFDRGLAIELLRSAAPIVPAIMIGVLTLKLDSLMVAALRPRREVGLYGAAYQPMEYALNAVTVVALPFFPILARAHGRDRAEFVRAYRHATEAVLAFILPITVVTVVAAGPMVAAVYQPQWSGSAGPMRVLSLALVFMALSAWNGFVLLAANKQRLTIRYGAAALLVSLVACLVLLPLVGFMGAVIAAVIANVVSATWSMTLLRRHLGVLPSPTRVLRVIGANVAMGAVATGLIAVGTPWWAACVAALAVYPFLLSAFGVMTVRSIALLLRRPDPLAAVRGAA